MIKAVTGKSALLSYSWYGCFCGIGGRGTPVDATDSCCHAHDCCYRRLRERCRGCPQTPPATAASPTADASFGGRKSHRRTLHLSPAGNEQSWCKRETCLCDKAVASCFAGTLASYNPSYRFYFKLRCRGSKLQC
uniref:Phospholipase A2 n=1 Tax=Anser cygnoides TaxID=8845 RepID=A0A8B9IJI7_ANSCY